MIRPAKVDWQTFLLLGVFLAALASSLASGELRLRWMPDAGWREVWGSRRSTRWALAFVGAFLVEVGASIAGGGTRGLAVSGGVTLSPGAFIFMAGMFAAGVPTAWLVTRRATR